MPSEDSASPSPLKRPGLNQRTSSTYSLSSSAKHQHKPHRPHVVGHRAQHGRNPSYGKNLNKLTRLSSTQNVNEAHHHQRKRSGPIVTEPTSPRVHIKRNASHVTLSKATSHVSLKKNHSATSLSRNSSTGQLKKIGLAPLSQLQPERKENTVGGFQLGDNSSEEGEAEWEDSSHSPSTTRQNSTSEVVRYGPDSRHVSPQKNLSPPAASLKDQHKSTPDLAHRDGRSSTPNRTTDDAPSIIYSGRSSRAPPAMSSVAAFARPPSSATLHRDVKNAMKGSDPADQTNASSSAENGVSHFVNGSLGAHGTPKTPELASDDDYESPSSFLPHYHPQTPSGATQTQHRSSSGLLNRRANGKTLPSRTQQRLELQRRETMRSSATPSESDPADVPLSLRARSASRVRGRSSQDNFKAAKRDYESASSQLEVIKRFRNPIAEALHRLQEMEVIPDQDDKISNKFKDRPISRAGSRKSLNYRTATTEGRTTQGHEDRSEGREKEPRVASRGRVRFERQGSHDDIGLSRSHGDEEVDEAEAEGEDPVSAEEALLRRIWESRDVYEAT